jgi:phosphoglycolate phosphatase
MIRTAGALRLAMPALRPFPLMPEVLNDLGEARHVVIVSSNASDVVELFLKRHGIAGVAEVAGAESGRSKVAKIEALIARFPGQASYWFVGDTAGDMREARLAGATPLGVAWGWHGREELEAAGAERIADTPADLLAIVAPELAADFLGTG